MNKIVINVDVKIITISLIVTSTLLIICFIKRNNLTYFNIYRRRLMKNRVLLCTLPLFLRVPMFFIACFTHFPVASHLGLASPSTCQQMRISQIPLPLTDSYFNAWRILLRGCQVERGGGILLRNPLLLTLSCRCYQLSVHGHLIT